MIALDAPPHREEPNYHLMDGVRTHIIGPNQHPSLRAPESKTSHKPRPDGGDPSA